MKQKTRYNFTAGNLETFVNKSSEKITWITGDRLVLRVTEMSSNHIENILEWIIEHNKRPNQVYLNRTFAEWTSIFKNELLFRINERKQEARKEFNELLISAGQLKGKEVELMQLVEKAFDEIENIQLKHKMKLTAVQKLQREWGF